MPRRLLVAASVLVMWLFVGSASAKPEKRGVVLPEAYFVTARLERTLSIPQGKQSVQLLAFKTVGPSEPRVVEGIDIIPAPAVPCSNLFFIHDAKKGDAEKLAAIVGKEVTGIAVYAAAKCDSETSTEWTEIGADPDWKVAGVPMRAGKATTKDLAVVTSFVEFFDPKGARLPSVGTPMRTAGSLLLAIGSKPALEMAIEHDVVQMSTWDDWKVPDKDELLERGLYEHGNVQFTERLWDRSADRTLELFEKHWDSGSPRLPYAASLIHHPRMYDFLIEKFAGASAARKDEILSLLAGGHPGVDEYVEPFLREHGSEATKPKTIGQVDLALKTLEKRKTLGLREPRKFAVAVAELGRGDDGSKKLDLVFAGMRFAFDGAVKGSPSDEEINVLMKTDGRRIRATCTHWESDLKKEELADQKRVHVEGVIEWIRLETPDSIHVDLRFVEVGPSEPSQRRDPDMEPSPPDTVPESTAKKGCSCGIVEPNAKRAPMMVAALLLAAFLRRARRRFVILSA